MGWGRENAHFILHTGKRLHRKLAWRPSKLPLGTVQCRTKWKSNWKYIIGFLDERYSINSYLSRACELCARTQFEKCASCHFHGQRKIALQAAPALWLSFGSVLCQRPYFLLPCDSLFSFPSTQTPAKRLFENVVELFVCVKVLFNVKFPRANSVWVFSELSETYLSARWVMRTMSLTP